MEARTYTVVWEVVLFKEWFGEGGINKHTVTFKLFEIYSKVKGGFNRCCEKLPDKIIAEGLVMSEYPGEDWLKSFKNEHYQQLLKYVNIENCSVCDSRYTPEFLVNPMLGFKL